VDVFELRAGLIRDYSAYVRSFIRIRDERLREHVDHVLSEGHLWPEPLIQLNPSFEPGASIDDLVRSGILHQEAGRIFRKDKDEGAGGTGRPLRLHLHQEQAVRVGTAGHSYVLTTGTGSGKSLAYIVPIVDRGKFFGNTQSLVRRAFRRGS
jgi:ATP-dependent helicase YprA (DUF1998 family)